MNFVSQVWYHVSWKNFGLFKSCFLFNEPLKQAVLKWTLYYICHNGMESCFLEEFLIIQVLFSVWWTFKASCFEMNSVLHLSQWYAIMFSWGISDKSSLFTVRWTFKASCLETNFVSHTSQWYGIMFSWRIFDQSSLVFWLKLQSKLLKWSP